MLVTIFLTAIYATSSHAWPASNYSKSAASYGIGTLNDQVDWSQHPCKRECKDNDEPMTCRYGFIIERYAMMSSACYDCPRNVTDCFRPHCIPGDGSPTRTVIVANRQLPGLSIEVCLGDRIIVDVKNMLNGETTAIHWHGIHQRGTSFMDGVPMISQCPIQPGESFRYDFVAGNAGTHWWHSHSHSQRSDGLFGGLIVRKPPTKNPVGHTYDRDQHVVILSEWSEFQGPDLYTLFYQTSSVVVRPRKFMINGLGAQVPRSVFHVEKGTKYRFRVIHAGSLLCPVNVTIDRHPMLIVSSDGADVEPIEVNGLHLFSGERYDFVIEANREIGNYWIRVSATSNCAFHRVHQEAILRYAGAAEVEPSQPIGYRVGFESDKQILNPEDQGFESENATCVPCLLRSIEPDAADDLRAVPDHQFYLNFDFLYIDNDEYHRRNLYGADQVSKARPSMMINYLSFETPGFPLQTQPELISRHYFCNVTEAKCTRERCNCPHALQVKLNSSVEFVLVDEAIRARQPGPNAKITSGHPVHLHGYYFRVLAMEKLNATITAEQVRELDGAGKILRRFKAAPLKDTIGVPAGGYTVVRLRVDNPGYWFLHCHNDLHSDNGMAMVIKVGEHEDFPPAPEDFPKCFKHRRR